MQKAIINIFRGVVLITILIAVWLMVQGYQNAYNAGFNACIEEANLYELYNN